MVRTGFIDSEPFLSDLVLSGHFEDFFCYDLVLCVVFCCGLILLRMLNAEGLVINFNFMLFLEKQYFLRSFNYDIVTYCLPTTRCHKIPKHLLLKKINKVI